jgi:hypothetical protein
MPEDVSTALQPSGPTGLQRSPVDESKILGAKADCIEIEIQDVHGLANLTAASKIQFRKRVSEFACQVLRESRSLEQADHAGSGPPEITAAHIDEGWFLTKRRFRRPRHPIMGIVTRFVQAGGIAGFGIGATSLKQSWGPAVFVLSALATILGILIEAYLSRSE